MLQESATVKPIHPWLRKIAVASVPGPTTSLLEQVVANLPVWYSFLDERNIRKGDRMHYRVHGDTLHSQYVGVDGEIFLDQKDLGESPRLAEMGSYFVRGSSFREKLIKSLFVE